MKKNSKPELTPTWWNDNKPVAWSDTHLEIALSAYSKGVAALERDKSEEAFESANDLLDQVEKQAAAAEKIAKEKPKKEPKDYDAEDFDNTAEVLKKFGSYIRLERKRIEDLVEEENEEDDKGFLLDEEAYKKYLKQKMKKMQSKALVFALALSKPSSPEEHRFLFHKSKDGKKLGMQILDEVEGLEMKKLTWGMAGADPQISTTLVLMLEHKQLPGMVKQGNKFLKAFKPLPFDTIKLVSAETGEELHDLPDPEDTEADKSATATGTASEPSTPSPKVKPDLLARLNTMVPRIKEFAAAADVAGQKAGADLEAKKTILAPKNRLLTLVRDCKGMIGTNDEQAEAMLADIEGILSEGQVDVATPTPSPKEKPDLLARFNALIPRIKEFAAAADVEGQKAGADLEAKKTILAPKNRLLTLVRDCKGMIGTNDEQAEAILADIEGILSEGQVDVATSNPIPKEKPDLLARLNALIPRIKEFAAAADLAGQKAGADLEAKKTILAPKNRLLTLVRDCKGMIGKNDEQAGAMLNEVEELLANGDSISTQTVSATGFNPPSVETSSNWPQARQEWTDANDRLNDQLNALRIAILEHAESAQELAAPLAEIADKGLNALTGNHRVRLMGSLAMIGDGTPTLMKSHGANALGLVNEFKEFLASNEKIDACEGNPFDVEVTIRGLLEPALNKLSEALRSSV